jgi:putative inorganic carbon (HCO3(-)) transporter
VLRSSWLLLLYLAFLGLGIATPFVMTLGYVWVDTFRPQEVAWFILNELPVALIMGAGAVVTYFAMDRRSPPPMTATWALQIMIPIYATMTLLWAELPVQAWAKWDASFKAMAFAAFVPLVIRSRVQIEAFAQTFVFALAANFVPFGLKVLISGGGYGANLGLQGGNSGLAEGGQLSAVCLMAVPLIMFLGKHGQLIPRLPMMNVAYFGVAILAVLTAIGTYERSALVGLVGLAAYMFMRSRNKFAFILIAGLGTVVLIIGAASILTDRASSIADYQSDGSAITRILVWKWTLGYVMSHPLGGSFDAYLINEIVMPGTAANPAESIQHGRAYHSIYFEVLGILGWPGIFMYLGMISSTYVSLIRLSRKCRKLPDLVWVADMSNAVQSGMLAFLTAGAFVGIAFIPPFWYFISMGICLRAYVWHAERAGVQEVTGWRYVAQQLREGATRDLPRWEKPGGQTGGEAVPVPQGWRAVAQARRGKPPAW